MKRKKNLEKFIIRILLISVAFVLTTISKTVAKNNFKILDSTNRGVTIQINPVVEYIDTVTVNGERFLKIRLQQSELTGDAGEPQIPIQVISLGIPQEASASASLLSSNYTEMRGKLLPAPKIDRNGVRAYKSRDSIYESAGYFPSKIVEISEPALLRNQRVIQLFVKPIVFSGRQNKIRIYKSIVIRVNFTGNYTAPVGELSSVRPRENEFYQGLISNYSQSKKWLKKTKKRTNLKKSKMLDEFYYKAIVSEEGFYKISGNDLAALGADLNSIDPNTIRVYNNGGTELPRGVLETRPDSLIENSIRVVDGGDGSFDSSDYILFYGRPVNHWEPLNEASDYYAHYINHYTKNNVYWVTWGNEKIGRRMTSRAASANPDLTANFNYYGRYYDEDEINNFLDSGLEWFGRLMAGVQSQGYSAYLPDANNIPNNAFFRIRLVGMTSGTHRFNFYLNDQFFSSYSFNGSQSKTYETETTMQFSESGYNNLRIEYTGYSPESQVYIDWFEIQYKKVFEANDNFIWFPQVGDGEQKYRVTNFESNEIEIYDVSNWAEVQMVSNTEISSGSVTFVDNLTGFPRHQYIGLTPAAYKTPQSIEFVNPANLRGDNGADYIIITHDDFYDAVMDLKNHREQRDSLDTEVVKISDIYNEFSWGLFDATAIRDFIKYAFENWDPQPMYVLLCGDGDYDYKNIKAAGDKNWIPPYETTELSETSNRTSDDWFVTVSGGDSKPDMAIGRFTVQTAEETENVVDKIISYETRQYYDDDNFLTLDDWRNVVTMVGDDEFTSTTSNETMHTNDAEMIIEGYVPNSFEKCKVYLIEYPGEKDPSTSGTMKPAATEALLRRINKGTLILNYIGHGAPSLWAHERVLKESRDFERIQNKDRLPLWIAASCDFGRFDDPLEQGFSEKLFAAKDIGGIAFVSSARLAYATDNTALNRQFYNKLLYGEKPSERLGIALMKAKEENYSETNDQKYHLFGDPTLRLNAPEYSATIASIEPDTLKALSKIKVTGYVNEMVDSINFVGKALLKAIDSKKYKTYVTARNSVINYYSPGNTVFRGTISVDHGQFSGEFIVPKDISYGGELGRISLYFANENIHGIGYRGSLNVGGTSFMNDTEGPIINIGFQGQNFVDGNLIEKNSVLDVEIADSLSGVNIVGDIGHNITMVIDDDESEQTMLTDYFNYYENNFKAGKILFDLSSYVSSGDSQEGGDGVEYGLPEGYHTLTIKAWDNFNNSSVMTTNFTVVSGDILEIKNVFNFPNPFSSATTFTFVINKQADVKIKIYTLRGTLIETLTNINAEAGLNQLYWDGKDNDGDEIANGVYLYKIIAKSEGLEKTLSNEKIGKMVIAR